MDYFLPLGVVMMNNSLVKQRILKFFKTNSVLEPTLVNPTIQNYYENIKIVVFATQINTADVALSLTDRNIGLVDEITNFHITVEETD